MKKLIYTICLVGLISATTSIKAATCTAVSGDWYSKSTWLDGRMPNDGDVVIIPAGVNVTVDFNCGTYDGMSLLLNGTLNFAHGRKFQMGDDGVLTLGGKGLITGGNGGSKFIIGSNEIYVGGGDEETGPIIGPTTCNSRACNLFAPLKLVSFAARQICDGILVTWSTDSETNSNYYFSLEKSVDGINFEKIAQVNGVGKSVLTNDYHFGKRVYNSYKWGVSQNIVVNEYNYLDKPIYEGNNFYRLKQTDFNGNYEYFNILTVCDKVEQTEPVIYPNVNDDEKVNVYFHNKMRSNMKLSVFSLSGTPVMHQEYESDVEFLNETIDLSNYKKGQYYVYFQKGEDVLNYKISVKE